VVQATLGTTSASEPLVETILTRARGNPFFLEELARAVGDPTPAPWRLVEVPETVQAVLAACIDRLPASAKRLLQVAAVIGKEVPVPLLRDVAEVPEEGLEQDLQCLQACEFLDESAVVPERVYTFRRVLVQEVAYQSLLMNARQELHRQTAQALAGRSAATAVTQPELVARHYTEAGHAAQAIAYWLQAGQRALQHSANAEAIQHLMLGGYAGSIKAAGHWRRRGS
jgi:predicted ATPase